MSNRSRRIAIKIEYDGGKFCGSQLQLAQRTVQLELESALNIFFRTGEERAIKVILSGRTDTGVHALSQVAHFDLEDDYLLRTNHTNSQGLFSITGDSEANHAGDTQASGVTWIPACLEERSCRRICRGLNGILPSDLSIVEAQQVPVDFHARFTAIRRTYVYRILNRAQRTALGHKMQYFLSEPLAVEAMKLAAASLLGKHDFAAFKSSNREKASTVCLIDRSEILNKGEGELEFWISSDHFVYNMVRIIVGSLIEVGLGKRAPSALAEALAGKDRHLAGPTAPPWGLCLYSVEYPAEFKLFQNTPEHVLGSSQEK